MAATCFKKKKAKCAKKQLKVTYPFLIRIIPHDIHTAIHQHSEKTHIYSIVVKAKI